MQSKTESGADLTYARADLAGKSHEIFKLREELQLKMQVRPCKLWKKILSTMLIIGAETVIRAFHSS